MERFSPVRRGSEGSNSGARTLSPSTPQQECQRLQRGLASRASPPRSIPGMETSKNAQQRLENDFPPGSPIHQHQLVSDSQHRHQKAAAESSSPIHQFYTGISEASGVPQYSTRDHNFKLSDATLGLPPESYQPPAGYVYDANRSYGNSPLHSANISPYASTSSNLGSPIHQGIYGAALSNLGLYSGTSSPIMNPLLSPNASPVFGGYTQGGTSPLAQPTSISSITQGEFNDVTTTSKLLRTDCTS